METKDKINSDLKEALKSGNVSVKEVLRMLVSDIKNKALAERRDLTEEEVIAVVKKQIKSRKDSVEQFLKGNREDLAEKERNEIEILEKYMPAQLGEEEIRKIVSEVVADLGEKVNFGLVMKESMQKIGSDADGAIVSKIVKEILA